MVSVPFRKVFGSIVWFRFRFEKYFWRRRFVSSVSKKIKVRVSFTSLFEKILGHRFVSKVVFSGQCGSCWAFSAVGALEGQMARKTGQLVALSEQNLIDCSSEYGNLGCNGGLPDSAFQYVEDNGGIDTAKSYPYKAKDGVCHFNESTIGGTDRGFVDLESGDEEALKMAVAAQGPISVAIDARESIFTYRSGLFVLVSKIIEI